MVTGDLAQFIVAVMSSLTTFILLWILRQFVKLRKSAERHTREHRYLMATMEIVLAHLGLEALTNSRDNK